MTFGEWLESERMTGNTDTEYLSAWLGWTAGQKAEREKYQELIAAAVALAAMGRDGNEIDFAALAAKHAATIIKEQKEKAELIAAAEAVISRWETPLWKDVEPTAEVIYRMRDVIERMKEKAE